MNAHIPEMLIIFKNKRWKMLSERKRGSKPFKNISKILKNKRKNIPLLIASSKIYVTKKEKANHLAATFATSFGVNEELHVAATELNLDNVIRGYGTVGKSVNFSAVFIKRKGLRDIVNRIKLKLSAGVDIIPKICLKKLPRKAVVYSMHASGLAITQLQRSYQS